MRYLAFLIFTGLFVLSLHPIVFAQERIVESLNSGWSFMKGDIAKAEKKSSDTKTWSRVNIPHTWNARDALDDLPGYYRGKAWYRKQLDFSARDSSKRYFLYFEGVNQVARVFLNGSQVGKPHIGGYTSFAYDITPYIDFRGLNLLSIQVDNSHDENIIPLDADFTFFGGIYRDVHLISTAKVHFDILNKGSKGVFITTPKVSRKEALVHVRSDILNESGPPGEVVLENILIDGKNEVVERESEKLTLSPYDSVSVFEEDIVIQNPQLWSPDNPYLYRLITQIRDRNGKVLDKVENPVGFRWFRFHADSGFFLNGEHVKLIGSNRHQDYEGLGNALPDEIHRYDLKRIKEMGTNFIRVSHYPHDPAMLEMCDKLGLVAIEEIPFVNQLTMTDEFRSNTLNMLREMIRRDYNHPSIVAWCTGNETSLGFRNVRNKLSPEDFKQYKTELRELLKELNLTAKQEDSARYTMTVHCCGLEDNYELGYHQADIIGYNQYWGWYTGEMGDVTEFFRKFRQTDSTHPFILSEYGAGADPRIHTYEPKRFDFSVEYQTKLHQTHLQAVLDNRAVTGSAIWNYADFQSEFRGDAVPHINSKGVNTIDRRPKDSYYYYKAVLSENPYVVIPSKLWNIRSGMPEKEGENYSVQNLEIYGNTGSVELFLNNRSLGKKEFVENKANWDVPFRDGTNLLEVRAIARDTIVEDFLKVNFQMQPRNMTQGQFPFKEIAVNVGSHFYFIDDTKKDFIWLPDKPYEEGNWGYTGGKTYLRDFEEVVGSSRNIHNTTIDPVYQTQRYDLKNYKFDVPDGKYELTLLFSELLEGYWLQKYLDNEEKETELKDYERRFSVKINGKYRIKELNISEQYGLFEPVSKRFVVHAKDKKGITIEFEEDTSLPVLNGVKLRRVDGHF